MPLVAERLECYDKASSFCTIQQGLIMPIGLVTTGQGDTIGGSGPPSNSPALESSDLELLVSDLQQTPT
jgi:hypothetical protein